MQSLNNLNVDKNSVVVFVELNALWFVMIIGKIISHYCTPNNLNEGILLHPSCFLPRKARVYLYQIEKVSIESQLQFFWRKHYLSSIPHSASASKKQNYSK